MILPLDSKASPQDVFTIHLTRAQLVFILTSMNMGIVNAKAEALEERKAQFIRNYVESNRNIVEDIQDQIKQQDNNYPYKRNV